MSEEAIYQAAKFQVEYFFGQTNYKHDDYLKKAEGPEGWILLSTIFAFRKFNLFRDYLAIDDLFEVLKLSTVVEVKEDIVDYGDEQIVTYYIRKSSLKLNNQYVNLFG